MNVEEHWLHVGIMYLRPERPTFWRLRRNGEAYGRISLTPVGTACGKPDIVTGVGLVSSLNLDRPMTFELFKLVSFDRRLHPWSPSQNLCVEPLHAHTVLRGEHTYSWWRGRVAEEQLEEERLALQRRAAERRNRRRQNAATQAQERRGK